MSLGMCVEATVVGRKNLKSKGNKTQIESLN